MEVCVATGAVSVQTNSETDKANVLLTANRKVTFYPDSERLVTGIVEHPQLLKKSMQAAEKIAFNFRDVPLPEILREFEKAYGLKIKMAADGL